MDVKLGHRRNYHKGRAAIRRYANLREPSFQALLDTDSELDNPELFLLPGLCRAGLGWAGLSDNPN